MEMTRYLMSKISGIPSYEIPFENSPHFNEFTMKVLGKNIHSLNNLLLDHGIIGGYIVDGKIPGLENSMIVSVSDRHTFKELDAFVRVLGDINA